jgi:hypothetical protein
LGQWKGHESWWHDRLHEGCQNSKLHTHKGPVLCRYWFLKRTYGFGYYIFYIFYNYPFGWNFELFQKYFRNSMGTVQFKFFNSW